MSRRKELDEYVETGRLRDAVSSELSEEATDLLVDLVRRYCSPRRKPAWKRVREQPANVSGRR